MMADKTSQVIRPLCLAWMFPRSFYRGFIEAIVGVIRPRSD